MISRSKNIRESSLLFRQSFQIISKKVDISLKYQITYKHSEVLDLKHTSKELISTKTFVEFDTVTM